RSRPAITSYRPKKTGKWKNSHPDWFLMYSDLTSRISERKLLPCSAVHYTSSVFEASDGSPANRPQANFGCDWPARSAGFFFGSPCFAEIPLPFSGGWRAAWIQLQLVSTRPLFAGIDTRCFYDRR